MITHPANKFTCEKCDYTAQVIGSRYYEFSCKNVISTRKCDRCNRLSDIALTKKLKSDFIPSKLKFKKVYKQARDIYPGEFWHEYANYIALNNTQEKIKKNCYWCNSSRTHDWDRSNPICPKCNVVMVKTEGEQIVLERGENFNSYADVISSAPKVVVCYMENWCVPCLILNPVLKEIQAELPNEFRFITVDMLYAVNYKLHDNLLNKFIFPTFFCYENGQFKGKFKNVDSKPELLKKLRSRFEL